MAIDFSEKKSNYISQAVQIAEKILEVYDDLRGLDDSEKDQKFLDENSELFLRDSDFVGNNNHLDLNRFMAALKSGIRPIRTAIEDTNGGTRESVRSQLRKLIRR